MFMEEKICYHFTTAREGISEQDMLSVSPARLSWWLVRIGDDICRELLFRTVHTSLIDPLTLRCRVCGKQFSHKNCLQEIFNYTDNKTSSYVRKHARKYSDEDTICRANPSDYENLTNYRQRWDYIAKRIPRYDFNQDSIYIRLGKEAAPTMFIEYPDGTKTITAVLEDPKYWRFINQEEVNI